MLGPPHSPSEPSAASAVATSVPAVAQHELSDPTLKPPEPIVPAQSLMPSLGPSEIDPLIVSVPPAVLMFSPAVKPVSFSAKVLFTTVAVPPACAKPPPLPETVLLRSTTVPWLLIPPAPFSEIVVPTTLAVLVEAL